LLGWLLHKVRLLGLLLVQIEGGLRLGLLWVESARLLGLQRDNLGLLLLGRLLLRVVRHARVDGNVEKLLLVDGLGGHLHLELLRWLLVVESNRLERGL